MDSGERELRTLGAAGHSQSEARSLLWILDIPFVSWEPVPGAEGRVLAIGLHRRVPYTFGRVGGCLEHLVQPVSPSVRIYVS